MLGKDIWTSELFVESDYLWNSPLTPPLENLSLQLFDHHLSHSSPFSPNQLEDKRLSHHLSIVRH
jgi:hypothetical protein